MLRLSLLFTLVIIVSIIFSSSASTGFSYAAISSSQKTGGEVSVETAKMKKPPPSSTSLANAFAARPHGNAARNQQQQQQQQRQAGASYLTPSPEYQEAFHNLAAGNMTALSSLTELATTSGDGYSQMLLGVLYGVGIGVPRDEAKSKLYHSFAALNGVSESTIVLALEAERDHDCEEALPLAKRAADVSARFNSDGSITPRWDASRLTTLEEKEATTTESEFDVQLLLAERGDARACCHVGYAYMLGLYGVEQDGAAAQLYFERGMNKEEAACFSGMGQLYARGVIGGTHPIARDPQLAAKYYKKGAELNHPPSLNGLGYLYAAGALSETGDRDFQGAAQWFDKSASLNSPPGAYNLGLLYLNGKGVKQDSLKAFEKFKKAAAMGSVLATYQLANMFSIGAGPVTRHCQHALTHFNQVQRLGPWNLRWNYARSALRNGNPGEALLQYLILGALGRAKASQNAMFVIERFFDRDHPLVSFNGTIGSDGWQKEVSSSSQSVATSQDAPACVTNCNYRSILLHRLVLEAAKHGSADAKLDLAAHHWDGIGTPKNRILAKEAYQAAANEGNVEAMYMLGWLHSTAFEEIYENDGDKSSTSSDVAVQVKDGQEKETDEVEDDEDPATAPRKRRILTASSSSDALNQQSSSSSARKVENSNTHSHNKNDKRTRGKRDIHLAKRNYDRVLEMSPQSWFAVRLALLRLNFLWWYDHYFTNPPVSSTASGGGVSSSSQQQHQSSASTTIQEQIQKKMRGGGDSSRQHQPNEFKSKMTLKQTYTMLRRLALEVLKYIDPQVAYGYLLSEVLLVMCVGGLIVLLLIRHHAFGV